MQKYKQAIATITFLTIIMLANPGYCNFESNARARSQNNKQQAEDQTEILQTFEDGDYQKWRELVASKGDLVEVVSDVDFQQFVLSRKLARSGQYDKAFEIASDLEAKLTPKINIKDFS